MNAVLKKFIVTSHLYATNAAYLETLYEQFLEDPNSLPPHWKAYFERFESGIEENIPLPARVSGRSVPSTSARASAKPHAKSAAARVTLQADAAEKQAAVLRLINAYRVRGHQKADIDPIHLFDRPEVPDLDPEFHGLRQEDLALVFNCGSLNGPSQRTLKDIINFLNRVYCDTMGAEYMHITDTQQKRWIQEQLEVTIEDSLFQKEYRLHILERLIAAEGLERYLHTRYVGQKRFSLEGAETLIPCLDELILRAGTQGVKEIVIGMAHRGRLNVLVNTMGKEPCDLFQEFEGVTKPATNRGSGDVKYHMGFSADANTPGGPVHLALAFNPSHLEIIGPVVEGSVRARQQRRKDQQGNQVLPILIHGDSAFAGQGVVMENFNMSQARGYTTGGTIHIVINNQIGFTTSNRLDTRSTQYCTDVAKMVQAPIFHVNGDDPEAMVFTIRLANDFRMTFKKDVVVDMICYRRHGHNEADEPAVTQPIMYQKIRSHPTVCTSYGNKLVKKGLIDAAYPEQLLEKYRQSLEQCHVVSPHSVAGAKHAFAVDWTPYNGIEWDHPTDTGYPLVALQDLATRMLNVPEGFELHSRVARIMDDRRKMAAGALALDWGFAEVLAYATLLEAGKEVRISGQDSGRGTFFHRHAVLHNQQSNKNHVPLQHISEKQAKFIVIDSLLSEEAVLAFEYGYATTEPNALVIWEAQFGDFANGAQVVIDQFISSGEAKWNRMSGIVLFLPHGYEGQGAEHSSARLERYLQLSAEHNIQICVPTLPSQMFHMLRRQILRPYRKPLIVMTPKSLLRHRLSVSKIEDLSHGQFNPVIGDAIGVVEEQVERIILCSGKVYFDLEEEHRNRNANHVVIIRIEQLYPFPQALLSEEIKRYPSAKKVVWCQEEPKNQGAWYQSQHHIRACMVKGQRLAYAGRDASASPAVGKFNLHIEQQRTLVHDAFTR